MEEITWTQVIGEYAETVAQMQEIARQGNIEAARKTVSEINNLIDPTDNNNSGMFLHDLEVKAELRKRIENGEFSRDEFIRIYKSGKDIAVRKISEIQKQIDDLIADASNLVKSKTSNVSDMYQTFRNTKNLYYKIQLAEQMRNNALKIPRLVERLKCSGFFTTPISNIDIANKFVKEVVRQFELEAERTILNLKTELDDQKENIDLFNSEINRIKQEKAALAKNSKMYIDGLEIKARLEKECRSKQIDVTFNGNPDFEKKWNETINRFFKNRINTQRTIVLPTKATVNIDYLTIDNNYLEYEEDAHFLNLDDYKRFLELSTIYDSIEKIKPGEGLNIIKLNNIVNFNDLEFKELSKLTNDIERKKWFESYINQAKEYVKTFHGFTNEHAVKYETWKTAGTMFKSMKNLNKEDSASKKIGIIAENVGRFFLLKPWDKDDTVAKKVITAVTDLIVVGGIASTAIFTPAALPAIGIGYVARGIVGIANKVRGKIEYNNHKFEIENNLPTMRRATSTEKEVMRQEFYKNQILAKKDKLGLLDRFSAWRKAAITDKITIWGRKRAKETEKSICLERKIQSDYTIDERTKNAKSQIILNAEMADKNHKSRTKNAITELFSTDSYNEMVRNVDKIQQDSIIAISARNALMRGNSKTNIQYQQRRESLNPDYKKTTTYKYQKLENNMDEYEALAEVHEKGQTSSVANGTKEQIHLARQRYQDRVNRIWTAALSIAGKTGLDFALTKFQKTITTEDKFAYQTSDQSTQQITPTQTHQEVYYEYQQKRGFIAKDISSGKDSDIGLNDIYGVGGQISKSKRTLDVDAVALRIRDKNGNVIGDVSFAESSTKLRSFGEKIPQVFAKDGSLDISHMTYEQVGEVLKATNPVQFKKYVESIGLPADASMERIMRHAIRKGDLFTQTKALEGWRQVSKENIGWVTDGLPIRKTRTVIDSVGGVTSTNVSGHLVVKTIHKTLKVFNSNALNQSISEGTIVGIGMGLIDSAQESSNQNNGNVSKKTENKTSVLSKLAKLAEKRENVKRINKGDRSR